MKEYFILQCKRSHRVFKDAGIPPYIAYTLLIAGFTASSEYLFTKTAFAGYLYTLTALALMGKLSDTKRTEFILLCFGDAKGRKIRIFENLLVALPFLAFLVYRQHYLMSFFLILLSVSMALVRFQSTLHVVIPTPFSKRPFEFIIGFRNTFYLIIFAYILTAMAVYADNFNLGIFALLLVFALTMTYYTQPENEIYVWNFALSPRGFLMEKIKTAWRYSFFMAFPLASILGIFFYENMDVLLLVTVAGWVFLVFMIVSKYANFPDEINIMQGVLLVLCISFPPLLLMILPYLFRKSEKRLGFLLK